VATGFSGLYQARKPDYTKDVRLESLTIRKMSG
jgi:hypothetical protein